MKKKIKKSLAVAAIAIVMGAGAFTNGFHVNEAKAQASLEPVIRHTYLNPQINEWCDIPGDNCLSQVVIKG